MATLVFFHAHPDDEAIATGGSMAKYAAAGHRVILVVATNGEHGEVPDDLKPGESLADRRRSETNRSAEILGVTAVHWLGYEDSGMQGWDQNGNAGSFHQAGVDEAGERLAAILRAERADVLTTYDWHGNYGHPDHVKVHHVGHRGAELAGTPVVYEATMNRDFMEQLMAEAREAGLLDGSDGDEEGPGTDDGNPFGTPADELTTEVDVHAYLPQKRASIAAHRSQVTDSSFFLQMPEDQFARAFGTEWYVRKGAPPGITEHDLV